MARRRDLIRVRLLAHPKSGIGGTSMFQFLRGIALIAAIVTNSEAAFAAEVGTADAMMPACRLAVGMQPNGPTNQFTYQNSGICIGIIDGLSFQSPGICTPSGVTIAQG